MITSLQILPIAFLPTYRLTSWLLKPCFSKLGNGIPFRQNEQLTTIASILFGFQPHGADYFQRTFTGPAWNEGPRLLSTQVLSLLPVTESGAKPSNARFPPAVAFTHVTPRGVRIFLCSPGNFLRFHSLVKMRNQHFPKLGGNPQLQNSISKCQ